MTRPLVAIVGRPNVGKSTLFNRLAGAGRAIVHDAPGVTRDRNYADAFLQGRALTLVDTGGLDLDREDPMGQGIRRQALAAIDEADVIVCLLDGTAPPTPADRDVIALLRKSGRQAIFAANKIDGPTSRSALDELWALGVEDIVPVSALHGRGLHALERAVAARVPPPAGDAPGEDGVPRVALVGRPNAGKSSLLNRLSGEERALVDSAPGTTRDPVDARVVVDGRELVVIDTAGIRRRPRVERGVESQSVMRSIRAVDRASVVVLVCDATAGIADQDQRLLGLAAERGRAIVVGVSKMDLIARADRERVLAAARESLAFAKWASVLPLSSRTGAGVRELVRRVFDASDEFTRRVPTGELNRFFEAVVARRPPPTHRGRAPRIYYVTQAETAPPVFVAITSSPEHVKESYRRFVVNQIRESFGFRSVPVTLRFRGRGGREGEPPGRPARG
ncbi:MAG: ribosome biogenesis GTPase Der [Polyangiaceae bacterium]|nr:ribosome biogenesis GTPase Der [Polyangiaceae bacterium]